MVAQERNRELAERAGRDASQSGDRYAELLAEGLRYQSKQDWRKAAKVYREAIALRPDEPDEYLNLGVALDNSAGCGDSPCSGGESSVCWSRGHVPQQGPVPVGM